MAVQPLNNPDTSSTLGRHVLTVPGGRSGGRTTLVGLALVGASVVAGKSILSSDVSAWLLALPAWTGLVGLLATLIGLGGFFGPLRDDQHLFENATLVESADRDRVVLTRPHPQTAAEATPLRRLHARA